MAADRNSLPSVRDPTGDPERVGAEVVDAALKVHRGLGPGLLESVYERVMERELRARGLEVERQKPVTFEFDGITYEDGLRVDLLVENVVVELKSVEAVAPVHFKQVLTYLRLMNLPLGFLVNFGTALLKNGGIRRILNDYRPKTDFRIESQNRA